MPVETRRDKKFNLIPENVDGELIEASHDSGTDPVMLETEGELLRYIGNGKTSAAQTWIEEEGQFVFKKDEEPVEEDEVIADAVR